MLVLFEYNGMDFLIRAKPMGKNGYYVGRVVYAERKDADEEAEAPKPKPVHLTKSNGQHPPPKIKEAAPRTPERSIDLARNTKDFSPWETRAKEFWKYLKEKNRKQGLVTQLFEEWRKSRGESRSPQLGFFIAACGERHGFWKIVENKQRTRFTLQVLD